mmetsp:Transcript_13059/g.28307  ORF Transcript_13059/g.28307 Transcript_13059/m.28307 type:complete len:231 (-) Transcript_13059:53-745(-)
MTILGLLQRLTERGLFLQRSTNLHSQSCHLFILPLLLPIHVGNDIPKPGTFPLHGRRFLSALFGLERQIIQPALALTPLALLAPDHILGGQAVRADLDLVTGVDVSFDPGVLFTQLGRGLTSLLGLLGDCRDLILHPAGLLLHPEQLQFHAVARSDGFQHIGADGGIDLTVGGQGRLGLIEIGLSLPEFGPGGLELEGAVADPGRYGGYTAHGTSSGRWRASCPACAEAG